MDGQASQLHEAPTTLSVTASGHTGNRKRTCLLLTLGGASLGLLSLLPLPPAFVWNYSESVPVGLYAVARANPVRGDTVAIVPSGNLRATLSAHGALPADRLLLKQVAAASGDIVCREKSAVSINGVVAALARHHTSDGRALPAWTGCRQLGADDVFVLTSHASSFDSRYFGPIDAEHIAAVIRPILTLPLAKGDH